MPYDPSRDSERALRELQAHAKRELRTRMKSLRRVLPLPACAERSSRANANIMQLPEFASARTVVAYKAMQKELDPAGVLARASELGKRIGLPRMQDDELRLHVYVAGDALVENPLGVLEPLPTASVIPSNEVDLIVVPALALDAEGFRLGYGRAFYDGLLPQLVNAFSVGVVYDFQLVAELPRQDHDVAVACVVSDARVLRTPG